MLRFLLEAYEGIGLVTTLDSHLGLIELSVAPGCEEEVAQILSSEVHNLQIRPVWRENEENDSDVFGVTGHDKSAPMREEPWKNRLLFDLSRLGSQSI
jgi:hypothetical protein